MKRFFSYLLFWTTIFSLLCGCGQEEIPSFSTDAERFKYEYESVNGKYDDGLKKSRILNISSDNPMIYSSYPEIIELMDSGDSFVVYFGFAKCPWCRACLEAILESAADCGIQSVYYIDVYTSRDKFEIQKGKTVKTQDGSEGYSELVSRLENVLSDYILYDDDEQEIKVGEKRIYAPNLIVVQDGVATALAADSEILSDPYMEITEDIYQDMKRLYTETLLSLE